MVSLFSLPKEPTPDPRPRDSPPSADSYPNPAAVPIGRPRWPPSRRRPPRPQQARRRRRPPPRPRAPSASSHPHPRQRPPGPAPLGSGAFPLPHGPCFIFIPPSRPPFIFLYIFFFKKKK